MCKKTPKNFFGIFLLGIHSLDGPWEWNCLTDVFDAAQPSRDAFDAHAKS